METPPPGWFEVNSIDQDNLLYHLEKTAAQEAWLGEKIAEVDRELQLLKLRVRDLELKLFLEYKSAPIKKETAKRGLIEVDASDEVAKAMAATSPDVIQMKELAIQAQTKRDTLRGYRDAFETKKSFIACLAGLMRDEKKTLGGNPWVLTEQ